MKRITKIAIVIIAVVVVIYLLFCFLPRTYNGIDISHHNNVEWEVIKKDNHIKFCYIKATEGAKYQDPKCIKHFQNAKKNNLYVGLYHYYKTNVSPKQQFNNFKSVYDKLDSDLIPVIDIENNGNNFDNIYLVNKHVSELIELYHKEYKTYPIIYLGSLNAIKVLPVIYNCPFWVRDIVNMFRPFSFSIKQTSIRRIGHNDIDCNYARNIDKLIINHPKR